MYERDGKRVEVRNDMRSENVWIAVMWGKSKNHRYPKGLDLTFTPDQALAFAETVKKMAEWLKSVER